MKCEKCGYEGARAEFRDRGRVGGSEWSCWIVRECPKCGQTGRYDIFKELEEDEERLRQLCRDIKQALDSGDLEKAFELRLQALQLSEEVDLEEEREFLAEAGRELKKRGYFPGEKFRRGRRRLVRF